MILTRQHSRIDISSCLSLVLYIPLTILTRIDTTGYCLSKKFLYVKVSVNQICSTLQCLKILWCVRLVKKMRTIAHSYNLIIRKPVIKKQEVVRGIWTSWPLGWKPQIILLHPSHGFTKYTILKNSTYSIKHSTFYSKNKRISTYHHSISGIGSLGFSLVMTLSATSIKFGFISVPPLALANCACFACRSFAPASPNWLCDKQMECIYEINKKWSNKGKEQEKVQKNYLDPKYLSLFWPFSFLYKLESHPFGSQKLTFIYTHPWVKMRIHIWIHFQLRFKNLKCIFLLLVDVDLESLDESA